MASFLLPRAVIRVAGDEAGAFLDALLTNDVSRATPEAPVYAALLSPQGKLFADLFAHRGDDGALCLDVAAARADELVRRLTMYRLRRRIEIEDVSADLCVEIGVDAGANPPELGRRTLARAPGVAHGSFADHEALRIGAGLPDPAVDAEVEEVFALEALLEERHGVDFQKGCFIGQENVSRMKRRATTRRKFCRIACDGAPLARGAPVLAGAVQVGEVRSAAAGAAIALVRLDRALAATEGLTAGGRAVRLDPPDWLILPGLRPTDGDD